MNLAAILTVIALIVNALALFAVAYQICQNRKSILLAKKSVDDDRRTRQAQFLPSLHFVINVQCSLSRWLEDIAEIMENVDKYSADHELNPHISGLPYIRVKTARMIKSEMFMFIILTVIVTSIISLSVLWIDWKSSSRLKVVFTELMIL